MPPTDEAVTAVVVTWDSADDVDACLTALRAQRHRPLEVVVVDNGSRDDTRARVAAHVDDGGAVPVSLVEMGRNVGFAAGVNAGIARSAAGAVLLVNPDAVLAPDHVGHLVAALAADPGLGSVQGTLVRPDGTVDSTGHEALRARLFRNRGEGGPPPPVTGPVTGVFGVTGAAALHRRSMLDDVAVPSGDGSEWLDETLFAYYDDLDLDWRARLRGWRAAHVPAATGTHRRGGAARRRSALVEELNAANRLLLVAKLDDRRSLRRAAPAVVATSVAKLVWLVVTRPRAAAASVARLRAGLPAARRRRQHALATAVRSPAAVAAGFTRFRAGPWVRRWWRRTTG